MLLICLVTPCWMPWPIDISAITAPTPMIMPSMVRLARSLFAPNARRAMRTLSVRFILILLLRGERRLCRHGRGQSGYGGHPGHRGRFLADLAHRARDQLLLGRDNLV